MQGSRKLIVAVLYILCVTGIGIAVLITKHDSLIGASAFATGMATGITAFIWGNRGEHAAKAQEPPK